MRPLQSRFPVLLALLASIAWLVWVVIDQAPDRVRALEPVYEDAIACGRDWPTDNDCVPVKSDGIASMGTGTASFNIFPLASVSAVPKTAYWVGPYIAANGLLIHRDGTPDGKAYAPEHAIRFNSIYISIKKPKRFIDFRDYPHGSRYRGPGENIRY